VKKTADFFLNKSQIYCAHQWAKAGAYRYLDTCQPDKNVVVMEKDGRLPDPTRGRIARFRRLYGHEAEIHIKRHSNLQALQERKSTTSKKYRLRQLMEEDYAAQKDWGGMVS